MPRQLRMQREIELGQARQLVEQLLELALSYMAKLPRSLPRRMSEKGTSEALLRGPPRTRSTASSSAPTHRHKAHCDPPSPREDGAGDPKAKGTASFLVADERTIGYGFAISGAEPPKAVHIHKGRPGENGDIVIPFANPPKDAAGQPAGNPGASSGCKVLTQPGELAALRRILSRPRGYYVNIHRPSFSDGAVRGELSRLLYDND